MYHNEVAEYLRLQVLLDLIKVVGDKVLVAVYGNASWQLQIINKKLINRLLT